MIASNLLFSTISFLIDLCALLLPNKTPSGTIQAHLPPIFNVLKNNAKNNNSVFLVLQTFNKFGAVLSVSIVPLNGGLANITEYFSSSLLSSDTESL